MHDQPGQRSRLSKKISSCLVSFSCLISQFNIGTYHSLDELWYENDSHRAPYCHTVSLSHHECCQTELNTRLFWFRTGLGWKSQDAYHCIKLSCGLLIISYRYVSEDRSIGFGYASEGVASQWWPTDSRSFQKGWQSVKHIPDPAPYESAVKCPVSRFRSH